MSSLLSFFIKILLSTVSNVFDKSRNMHDTYERSVKPNYTLEITLLRCR